MKQRIIHSLGVRYQAVERLSGGVIWGLLLLLCSVSACSQDSQQNFKIGTGEDIKNVEEVAIGSEGGVAEFWMGDEVVKIEIPPGALSEPISMTVREHPDLVPGMVGKVYDIGPSGTTFREPVTVSVSYAARDNPKWPLKPRYRLAAQSGNDPWELLPVGTEDADEIRGQTKHFSLFGVVLEPDSMGRISNQRGTSFSIGSVEIKSSDAIHLQVMSVTAATLRYLITSDNQAESTELTISGLRPNATVYIFDGSLRNKIQVVSDASGRVNYTQLLGENSHSIWLQETSGTVIVSSSDPSDCEAVGRWQASTKTCFLGTNPLVNQTIFEQIEIATPNTTVNCQTVDQDFNVTTKKVLIDTRAIFAPSFVVRQNADNFAILNCEIKGVDAGILVNPLTQGLLRSNNIQIFSSLFPFGATGVGLESLADNVTFEFNFIQSFEGIFLAFSGSNNFSNNIIKALRGITLESNYFNEIERNTIDIEPQVILGSAWGIMLSSPETYRNLIKDNILNGSPIPGPSGSITSAGIRIVGATWENNGILEFNEFIKNNISEFAFGITYDTNGRADKFTRNTIMNNTMGALKYGIGGGLILDNSGEPIQNQFVFLHNDVTNNGSPQIVSDFALPLHDASLGRGNYWGKNCPPPQQPIIDPFFDATQADSNRMNVVDLYPYGVPVAQFGDVEISPPHQSQPLAPSGCEDLDGDHFRDFEEYRGIDVYNPDDSSDFWGHLDLPGLGAQAHIPDIFVEIDYMNHPDTTPNVANLTPIVDVFRDNGINLHLDLGSAASGTEFDLGGGNAFVGADMISISTLDDIDQREGCTPPNAPGCEPSGLTFLKFSDVKNNNIDKIRRSAFFYFIYTRAGWATSTGGISLNQVSPGDSVIYALPISGADTNGVAEINGDRFTYTSIDRSNLSYIIISGIPTNYQTDPDRAIDRHHQINVRVSIPDSRNQAELGGLNAQIQMGWGNNVDYTRSNEDIYFMHEFGHLLGLRHGGFRDEHCVLSVTNNFITDANWKPNYISIMNYNWVSTLGCPNPPPRLNFSHGLAAPLDEKNLIDADGIQGLSHATITKNYECIQPNTEVDWNLNGITAESPHESEINRDFKINLRYDSRGMSNNSFWRDNGIYPCTDSETFFQDRVLQDHNDWANLQFYDRVGGLELGPRFVETIADSVIEMNPNRVFTKIPVIVKPGCGEVSPINIRSRGKVPVAFVSTNLFNATKAISSTATFGATGLEVVASHCALEDVNQDAIEDLICHFPMQGSDLKTDSQFVSSFIETDEGFLFGNTTPIRIVP